MRRFLIYGTVLIALICCSCEERLDTNVAVQGTIEIDVFEDEQSVVIDLDDCSREATWFSKTNEYVVAVKCELIEFRVRFADIESNIVFKSMELYPPHQIVFSPVIKLIEFDDTVRNKSCSKNTDVTLLSASEHLIDATYEASSYFFKVYPSNSDETHCVEYNFTIRVDDI